MILLAVDPGSANVGVSIFKGQDLLFCTRLNYTSNYEKFTDKLNDMLSKLYHEFLRLCHYYKVTHICWEVVPAIGGMNHKDFVVSVSAGLKTIAFQLEMQWQGVAATTAKKFITENGRASKEDVRDAVIELYPNIQEDFKIGFKQWDSYDSVIIGLTCMNKGLWHKSTPSVYTGKSW